MSRPEKQRDKIRIENHNATLRRPQHDVMVASLCRQWIAQAASAHIREYRILGDVGSQPPRNVEKLHNGSSRSRKIISL